MKYRQRATKTYTKMQMDYFDDCMSEIQNNVGIKVMETLGGYDQYDAWVDANIPDDATPPQMLDIMRKFLAEA